MPWLRQLWTTHKHEYELAQVLLLSMVRCIFTSILWLRVFLMSSDCTVINFIRVTNVCRTSFCAYSQLWNEFTASFTFGNFSLSSGRGFRPGFSITDPPHRPDFSGKCGEPTAFLRSSSLCSPKESKNVRDSVNRHEL